MGLDYFADGSIGALPVTTLDRPFAYAGEYPEVARLASGGFVVAWATAGMAFAQVYDHYGMPVGAPQTVSDENVTFRVAVAGLADGGFVISWEASDPTSGTRPLLARVFGSGGLPMTDTFVANERVAGNHQQATVTALADGGFAIGWSAGYWDTNYVNAIVARFFDGTGTPTTGDLLLTSSSYSGKYFPQATTVGNGMTVFTWSAGFDSAGQGSVYAQVVAPDGTLLGDTIRMATDASENFYNAVTALGEDRFLLTWTQRAYLTDGTMRDTIHGRVYDVAGAAVGSEFALSHGLDNAGQATATASGDGFTIVWRSDTGTGGENYRARGDLYAQSFGADGTPLGAEFLIDERTTPGQDMPQAAETSDGFVTVWQEYRAAGGVDMKLRVFGNVQRGTDAGETLRVEDGYLIMNGGGGADRLIGDAAANILDGGTGADRMQGGAGDDRYFVDDVADQVLERRSDGFDRVYSMVSYTLPRHVEELVLEGSDNIDGAGNALANAITGSAGDNILRGMDGSDTLTGLDGADRLIGGTGADMLNGGAGDDILIGGEWRDILIGGRGADRFVFADGHTGDTRSTADRIVDFNRNEGDTINLRAIDAISTTETDDMFTFIGERSFSGTPGELRYHRLGEETLILGDTNGDAIADIVIRVDRDVVFVRSDFVL